MARTPIPRAAEERLRRALARSPVVALVGPRQCGKTTLARRLVAADAANYFDLGDPVSLARLDQPRTALQDLAGVVVIDEVQHRPELFPVLRVLVDRDGSPARFLVLGSAGPALLRQSAESLAGRIEYVELTGFQVAELGPERMETLWVRGGFPRSVLAANDADSLAWRRAYVRSLVERDLPQFGADLRPPALHRFLTMLAHYQGQIKRVDAPRRTRSMAVAMEDLKLDALRVVYPGTMRYDIGDRIAAVPAREPFRPFDEVRG